MIRLPPGLTTRLAPLGLRAALVSCQPADPPHWVRTDSAGVTLIEYAPTFTSAPGVTLGIEPEPAVAIGDAALGLYGVRMARFLAGDGIAVANGGSHELLIFDAAGTLLARAEGEGDGPGEFRRLTFLSVGRGDSLFAFDERAGRVSVFDQSGAFARTVTLEGADTLGRAATVLALGSGGFVGAFHRRTPGSGLVRDSLLVLTFDATGARAATVGMFPHMYTHWGPHTHPGGGGRSAFPAPVPLSSLTAVSASDDAIYVGRGDRFELIRLGADGTRRVTRQERQPEPVTDLHRDRLFARLAARGRAGPEEDLLRRLEGPATLPAFGDEPLTESYGEPLVVTDGGGLWVRPFRSTDSASAEWWRFDGDGLYEGVVSVPGTFTPTAVRGHLVLGVHRDAMDVESVRVYRLRVAGTASGDRS